MLMPCRQIKGATFSRPAKMFLNRGRRKGQLLSEDTDPSRSSLRRGRLFETKDFANWPASVVSSAQKSHLQFVYADEPCLSLERILR